MYSMEISGTKSIENSQFFYSKLLENIQENCTIVLEIYSSLYYDLSRTV